MISISVAAQQAILFLLLARFLILFPLLLMLRRIVLRIVVSTERYFEVFDIWVRLALEPDLALSPEVHTEEAFARYHNQCIRFTRCTPLHHSHSVLNESISTLERRSSIRCHTEIHRCLFLRSLAVVCVCDCIYYYFSTGYKQRCASTAKTQLSLNFLDLY